MNRLQERVRNILPFGLKWLSRRAVLRLIEQGKIKAVKCDDYGCYDGLKYGLGAEVECPKCQGLGFVEV